MGVETEKYIRKPLFVDAVRVTPQNFDEIANWCQGEIQSEEAAGGAIKKFIKVRVHQPKNPRQTKAFVGDWILYTDRGYKVYTNKPFRAAFDLVTTDSEDPIEPDLSELEAERVDTKLVPKFYLDPASGELTETMPDVDATPLQFGELMNIVRNELVGGELEIDIHSVSVVTEEPSPESGVQPIQSAEPVEEEEEAITVEELEGLSLETGQPETEDPLTELPSHTPQGEEIEYVEATPEAIADSVNEEQPVQPPEVAPQPESVSEQPPEEATAGKRVLSEEEQRQMGPDAVRELVSTGEAILAQDLATEVQ